MASGIEPRLTGLQQQLTVVEQALSTFAVGVEQLSPGDARTVMVAVDAMLRRLIEAARPLQKACPECNHPDAQGTYVAVNTLSGIWQRDSCPICRELAQLLTAAQKPAGKK